VVKYLVEKNPASVNITNNKRETPVYWAAREGHQEVVKYLVEEANDDALIQSNSGYTAFHWIARRGWLDLVKYLAKKNPAVVNIKDNYGATALDDAKERCEVDDCSSVVEYLKTFKN